MTEIRNARIKSTSLGREDHGIMTCYLHLDYGGSGQGFGGYVMGEGAYGVNFITGILDTLEVSSWEKLPGTHLRVKASDSKVEYIGHIINDKWFGPADITPKRA